MDMLAFVGAPEAAGNVDGYTSRELKRVFHEHLQVALQLSVPEPNRAFSWSQGTWTDNLIAVGTRAGNPVVSRLLQDGFLPAPTQAQGYSMRCGPHPGAPHRWLLAIAGSDSVGALYALRDLEHYCLKHFGKSGDRAEPFERYDWPRIEHRGHWIWGCNMPDKPAWIENMSRWKLNELIHWDNYPPAQAGKLVALAHERGVQVAWGFGWGWNPDWNFKLPADFDRGQGQRVEMCGSSEANLRFFRREILRKVREDYAPTNCDGIYFQSFTECPKCECPHCAGRTMGELMLRFVNPIVDDIKREFPNLWVSCGVHHDFGDFAHLKDLDPRCNIYWENCVSGTSVRGENEDFGYLYKSIPYGHGFSRTCPADPPYSEDSLREWMRSNADKYAVEGGLIGHYEYMQGLQNWARRLLGKQSTRKHAGVVADHSVFCRRTPFPHVALAEAQWNPDLNTTATVDGILSSLGIRAAVECSPGSVRSRQDLSGRPPWLADAPDGSQVMREGHSE